MHEITLYDFISKHKGLTKEVNKNNNFISIWKIDFFIDYYYQIDRMINDAISNIEKGMPYPVLNSKLYGFYKKLTFPSPYTKYKFIDYIDIDRVWLPVFDTNPNDLDELTIPDLFKLKKNLYRLPRNSSGIAIADILIKKGHLVLFNGFVDITLNSFELYELNKTFSNSIDQLEKLVRHMYDLAPDNRSIKENITISIFKHNNHWTLEGSQDHKLNLTFHSFQALHNISIDEFDQLKEYGFSSDFIQQILLKAKHEFNKKYYQK